MKNITFILTYFLLFIFAFSVCAQENLEGNLELAVKNFTNNPLEIRLYPVSAIFNGNSNYSLIA